MEILLQKAVNNINEYIKTYLNNSLVINVFKKLQICSYQNLNEKYREFKLIFDDSKGLEVHKCANINHFVI